MNLVDSYGWLEYFADGINADFFSAAIESTATLLVPTICILEVFKSTLQQRGEDCALQVAALMSQGKVVELSTPVALRSAKLSHEMKLPLADSVILATAQLHDAEIWTQDADFKGLPNIHYIEPKFRSWMRRYGRKGQSIRIISAEGRYTVPL